MRGVPPTTINTIRLALYQVPLRTPAGDAKVFTGRQRPLDRVARTNLGRGHFDSVDEDDEVVTATSDILKSEVHSAAQHPKFGWCYRILGELDQHVFTGASGCRAG